MSGAVLEARAIIRGEDRTKAAFESIKARIAGINRQVEGFDRAFTSVGKVASQVDRVQVASGRAAGDMRQFVTVTNSVGTASRTAERSAESLTQALEREAGALKMAHEALAQAGVPTGRLAAEQERLARVTNVTTQAIERQTTAEGHSIGMAHRAAEIAGKVARQEEHAAAKRKEKIGHHGVVHAALAGGAAVVGVHGVLGAAEGAVEAGAERGHVIAGMKLAGMPDEEIARAQDLAERTAKVAPNLSVSQIMELHKESRSAVQHPEEAFALMPDLARAASVLKGMGADDNNVADLVKAGESLGLMNDPKRFHHFLEGQVKAMQVMGKTINTSQIYEAAKYSKSAGATLSDDFLNLRLPSLIQEMHGSSAGDALASLTKRWRGGLAHQHIAVTQLEKQGMLAEPDKIVRSKTGQIMGYTGKLVGDDLLGSDPDRFLREIWNPHAEKMGVNTLSDKILLLNQELPGVAANLQRILIQQAQTLDQHQKNYQAAPGLEPSVDIQKGDPTAAMKSFTAALNDLGAAASSPLLEPGAKALSSIAGAIREVSLAAGEHPIAAATGGVLATGGALAGAGAMSYQFMTGFGLMPAATHLEAAALALDGAAMRMGAAGVAGGLPGTVGKVVGGAAAGGLTLAGGAAMLTGGLLAGTTVYILSHDGTKPVSNGRRQPPSQKDTDHPGHWAIGRGGVRQWVLTTGPTAESPVPLSPIHHIPDFTFARTDRDFALESDSPGVGTMQPMPAARSKKIAGAGFGSGTGFGAQGDLHVSLDPESKIEGSLKVQIDLAPEIKAAISDAKIIAAGNVKAGGISTSGSVGHSYPQTAPTGRGGGGIGRA